MLDNAGNRFFLLQCTAYKSLAGKCAYTFEADETFTFRNDSEQFIGYFQ